VDSVATGDSLTLAISGPDSVKLGQPVKFVLTVTNNTGRPLRISHWNTVLTWLVGVHRSDGKFIYQSTDGVLGERHSTILPPYSSLPWEYVWNQLTRTESGRAELGDYLISGALIIDQPPLPTTPRIRLTIGP